MLRIGHINIRGPAVMGILNITPDSFSDGGSYREVPDAVAHALGMVDDGADIIDVGGESTRPGFSAVSTEEEISRVIPVIRGIRRASDVPISVDTTKAAVAREAISAGADIVNDVNSFRDEGMLECAADAGVPIVIAHSPTDVRSVHGYEMMGDPIPQIADFLRERIAIAGEHGIDDVIVDPGIGFGKTREQDIEIVGRLNELGLERPILVGLSRKRVLKRMYPGMDPDEATIRASLSAIGNGADIVRVHNVRSMSDAIQRICQ